MEELIVSLRSGKNNSDKSDNPYNLDKAVSAYNDQLDSLGLAICSMR